MKNIIRTTTAFILLIQLATTMNAQVGETFFTQRKDTVILRHGDVNYIRTGYVNDKNNGISFESTTIERVDTKDLKGQSYKNITMINSLECRAITDNILRSVFPQERAKQLENLRIYCFLKLSPVENRIIHIEFTFTGKEHEDFPLKMYEMYELEQRLRAEPKAVPLFDGTDIFVSNGVNWNLPLNFKRLYE